MPSTELEVKRIFGGELQSEKPIDVIPYGQDLRDGSPESYQRFEAVDADSRQMIFETSRRLCGEGWKWSDAVDLACGILPKKVKHWPARQRYECAAGLSKEACRAKVDNWFWRKHAIRMEETE
jgi:hypothetical protein